MKGLKMTFFLTIVALVSSYARLAGGAQDNRERMVTDMVKVNGSMFRAYGCYCGVDGIGTGEPKDYIDVCCQILNCCYERLKLLECHARTTSYKYTYDGDAIECYTANDSSWCEANICFCDRFYSICLQDSHSLFNKDFIPSGKRSCSGAISSDCTIH